MFILKIDLLHKTTNLYLTGNMNPGKYSSSETKVTDYTKEEINDFETTVESFQNSYEQGLNFKNPTLNLNADFNYVHGQFRMSGIGVINSFFSGLGSRIGSKLNFLSGLGLAGLSIIASCSNSIPVLKKKFQFLSLGSNAIIRGPLHVLDSIFSTIGEQGAKYNFPSLIAGGASLFCLNRSLTGKENKSLEIPFDSLGGTFGRTAVHHIDSMLASKASFLSSSNQSLGAFLATVLSTFGLLLPEKIKKKTLPWDKLEGFVAQGSSSFVDSLFSNIGNTISGVLNDSKKTFATVIGLGLGFPIIGKLFNLSNYKIPFGTLEGRLSRGIFHVPESFVFNFGSVIGNGKMGLPLSFGFAGLTGLLTLNKSTRKFLQNKTISRDSFMGMYQRLPFEFMYSVTSAAALKLNKFIPAPLLTVIGPALSFQLGEKLKGIKSRYDDISGLMLRNSIHIWEAMLSNAAYKTGKLISFGGEETELSAGSVLADGRWLTDDGRIVSTMAIGKQLQECSEKNIFNASLFSVFGIGAGYLLSEVFRNINLEKGKASNITTVSQNISYKSESSSNNVSIHKSDRSQKFKVSEREKVHIDKKEFLMV